MLAAVAPTLSMALFFLLLARRLFADGCAGSISSCVMAIMTLLERTAAASLYAPSRVASRHLPAQPLLVRSSPLPVRGWPLVICGAPEDRLRSAASLCSSGM